MTSVTPTSWPGDSDERMTADRDETKYLLPPDKLDLLASELNRRLPSHRFTGEGANRLPDPHHFVTTVYFDTPSRVQFRAASDDGERNVKIRAKEYYDIHPSLAELATDPAQIVRYQPWLWFEMKQREGTRTIKRRFRLPKTEVPEFFNGKGEGRVTSDVVVEGDREGLQEIIDYCTGLREPLSATCMVNYRRLSWQAPDGELRVTVDLGLAYYAPPPDLWTRDQALVRSTLGPVLGRETRVVVEVKRIGLLPAWLEDTLGGAGTAPVLFSKFLSAGQAVHGHG